MRQDLLFGGTYAGGAVKNFTIGRGHLNGLLFQVGRNSSDTFLTIKRRVGRNTILLVPNVRVRDLRRISSIEYGYDHGADAVAEGINGLLKAKIPASFTQADWDVYVTGNAGSTNITPMIYVDLGSIYLGGESELDITVTTDQAWGATQYPVRCYAITRERRPDFMLQTDYSLQLEETHRGVDALYLVGVDQGTYLNSLGRVPDITVQLQDDDQSTLTDWQGLYCATNIFSAIEAHAQPDTLVIYRQRDALPADVFCKVMGADSNLVRLIVRKRVYSPSQVSSNTLEELRTLQARTARLEAMDPGTAKALRHTGALDQSSTLARAAESIAQSNAADGIRK
jgi:hypothetical protein